MITSRMNRSFNAAMELQRLSHRELGTTYCDWLSFIGMPMLYDGGLFVNRTKEEVRVSDVQFQRQQQRGMK